MYLGDGRPWVGDVLEHLLSDDHFQAGVLEWQRQSSSDRINLRLIDEVEIDQAGVQQSRSLAKIKPPIIFAQVSEHPRQSPPNIARAILRRIDPIDDQPPQTSYWPCREGLTFRAAMDQTSIPPVPSSGIRIDALVPRREGGRLFARTFG
jgi:hypothetical protein